MLHVFSTITSETSQRIVGMFGYYVNASHNSLILSLTTTAGLMTRKVC